MNASQAVLKREWTKEEEQLAEAGGSPTHKNEGEVREPLLTLKSVSRSYGRFEALKGLSFQMFPGEIISVLGPSGCGKSTLLQIVAGLAQPSNGELFMNGKLIASERQMLPPEKRGVNMVFQDYALWPHMTVYDNIAYGLKRLRMPQADIEVRIRELLALLHLEGLERRLPPQLSGGQQQRVAIARALATRPQLLLLDEPLSNLDMRLRIEMRTEMSHLFRKLGTSVFHVTHDPEEAFAMADRLLIMRDGRIDQIGTPEHCYRRPATRWVCSLLGGINRLTGELVTAGSGAPALRLPESKQLICGTLPEGTEPGWKPSGQGQLLFRPDDATVIEPDALRGTDIASQMSTDTIPVTIAYSTFEGKRWRCLAETACGQKLSVLHDEPLAPGSICGLRVPVQSAFIYTGDER